MIRKGASHTMRTILFLTLCFGFWHSATNAAEKAKAPVVITAPAKLKPCGNWMCLTIADEKHNFELLWAMQPHYSVPVALESNRVYRFTVIKEPFRGGINITIPEVIRVEQDGRVIYDREVCQVHQLKMDRKKVPIVYGLFRPHPGEPSAATERQLFPHSRDFVLGGCVVGPEKTDHIFVCSDCKKAYEKWKTENPPKK